MWDDNEPSEIRRARLCRMPPERVYDDLKEYGAQIDQATINTIGDFVWGGDHDMEQALYNRSDPLINLGLAQFGTSWEVQSALYNQSFADTGDLGYSHAIRLAVLGNHSLVCDGWMRSLSRSPLNDSELLRLASTAGTTDNDELITLLHNPKIRVLISELFNRRPPFDQVARAHFHWMIGVASQNPGINERQDEHEGPDMTADHIQHGIWKLVQSLPVSEGAIEALYMLLDNLEFKRVYGPDEDPTPAILRWRSVTLSDEFQKRNATYRYTTLNYAEEFCCLAAALYGRWYDRSCKEGKTVDIGATDSPDLILRCAYYSNAGRAMPYGEDPLTADQMKQAHDKDGDAFTLAALCNAAFILNPKTRAVLDDSGMLAARRTGEYGDPPNLALRHLYDRRYKEVLGTEPPTEHDEPPATPELAATARVESRLASLATAVGRRLKIESVKTWWVLALLVLLLIVLWSRHF